jgi:hypothetical protein
MSIISMQPQIKFIRFEIEKRQYSPDAIIGIQEVHNSGRKTEQRVFICAPGINLGKQAGDQLALQIKEGLEWEHIGKPRFDEAINQL